MSLPKLSKDTPTHSSGKKGTKYTETERKTAFHVGVCVLLAASVIDDPEGKLEEQVPQEIVEAFIEVEAKKEYTSLSNLMRLVYKAIVDTKFDGDDDIPTDEANWPKKRDWMSVTLIFRKALLSLKDKKVNEMVDEAFKTYRKSSKKTTGLQAS